MPTTGQAHYLGSYAVLRDFDVGDSAGSQLQYTAGAVLRDLDFHGFNAAELPFGNGAAITGSVYNRRILNLAGQVVPNAVLAEINPDLTPDTPLTALPAMLFVVGPGVLDNNGEAEGKTNNAIVLGGAAAA